MNENTDKEKTSEKVENASVNPSIQVTVSPHLSNTSLTTQKMMIDVLIALIPILAVAIWVFKWHVAVQVGISVLSCLAFEALFTSWRCKKMTLGDCSAAVTGVILGLSLPSSVPWYVAFIGSMTAIGLGKIVFGGLGYNIFNPAMVGRAFVLFAFPMALGATAYQVAGGMEVLTQATPLTLAKQLGQGTPLWALLIGNTNGSLGETSAIACIIGGIYLCIRRTASWEIPVSAIVALIVFAGIGNLTNTSAEWTVLHHLVGGAFLFGAFFIATDPVTSPLTPKGKMFFGIGFAAIVMLIRSFSGYPEGVMFAVLLMNAITPLINKWTIPVPHGGHVPVRK